VTEKRPTLELAAGLGCGRVLDTWKRPTVVVVVVVVVVEEEEEVERQDGPAGGQEVAPSIESLWTPLDRAEEPCRVFSGLDSGDEEEDEEEVEDGVTEEEETTLEAS